METHCERLIELTISAPIQSFSPHCYVTVCKYLQMLDRPLSSNTRFVMQTTQKSENTEKSGTGAALLMLALLSGPFLSSYWPSEVGIFSISPLGAVFHPHSSSIFSCTRAENTYWHHNWSSEDYSRRSSLSVLLPLSGTFNFSLISFNCLSPLSVSWILSRRRNIVHSRLYRFNSFILVVGQYLKLVIVPYCTLLSAFCSNRKTWFFFFFSFWYHYKTAYFILHFLYSIV